MLLVRRSALKIQYIQLCEQSQNEIVERFIRTYREDVLDAYIFNSLDEARKITFEWLEEYNSIRPHAALGNKTPYEYSSNLESVYL
jgi:putative transposase